MVVAGVTADGYAKSLTAGMLQLNQVGGAALTTKAAEQGGVFQQLLGQAIDQATQLDHAADDEIKKFAAGESGDLHKMMIAGEKADLAFQLTMAIRNKMVEAYQEVMRMQI